MDINWWQETYRWITDNLETLKQKENRLTIQINENIEKVFKYSLESDNVPKFITSVRKEFPSDRPVKLGTHLRNVWVGSTVWDTYEVIEFLPPKTFTLKKLNSDYYVKYTCTENENWTEFEYYEWSENGYLEDPMDQEALERLKQLIEGQEDMY